MKSSILVSAVAGMLVVNAGAFQVFAQEQANDAQSRLEQISARVAEENARLEQLEKRQKKLAGEQAALNKSIADVRKALEAAKKKMDELEVERVSIEVEAQETDQRLVDLRALTFQRVRALAMQRKDRIFEQVLLRDSGESFARRAFFLRKIREHDSQLTRSLQQLFSEKRDHILVVKSFLEQQKKVESDVALQQKSLNEKIAKLDQVKKGIVGERKEAEQSLAELRAEALRLETVMVGLTGGEQSEGQTDSATISTEPAASAELVEFVGRGLKSVGHDAPVAGKILQRYGHAGGKGFESFLKSKGLEIQAAAGAKVHAIETGKVIFSGTMPGYGQIVILDHGDREYSLYGRLTEVTAVVGAIIQRGVDIATIGEAGADDKNFYFEIRKNGKPLNPGLFVGAYK